MLEWQAVFELEDKERNDREDERAMAIIVGVAHAFGGDGNLDFTELFPHYEFKEESEEVSVESSKVNVARAFGIGY